ncbi:FAD-binding molybdopterin dehydrogenase [Agromyces rhizosphaerae]|uniref:FAD-binding molybdopterin dehydrogenase n=1 Tax=Agromyces rhizosphaerae TaxID=88374 RepID=A0A9W6CYT9_9MICO|nr:FAD binding domain-containing protein [Agromyces rhizosphaerae]GLI28145.1 FAD-binding molybdopterin dehydrogenase [Agromyces rhizosphaerae]
MDLETVATYRRATSRADLALAPGERFVAGGTWLYSEPQVGTSGLVDLTGMGWASIEEHDGGLRIGATCTIAELVAHAVGAAWPAHPLVSDCANALLASFKVWNSATVGGNVCRAFAAAGMVSLCTTLDGVATIWTPDGGEERRPVVDLVAGNGVTTLADGEVLRAIDLPAHALRARTAFRKIALAELGRSGAVLTGRVDGDGAATLVITAATERPTVLRFDRLPDAATLRSVVEAAPGYYSDPLGSADWRRAVSVALLEDVREELAA